MAFISRSNIIVGGGRACLHAHVVLLVPIATVCNVGAVEDGHTSSTLRGLPQGSSGMIYLRHYLI